METSARTYVQLSVNARAVECEFVRTSVDVRANERGYAVKRARARVCRRVTSVVCNYGLKKKLLVSYIACPTKSTFSKIDICSFLFGRGLHMYSLKQ